MALADDLLPGTISRMDLLTIASSRRWAQWLQVRLPALADAVFVGETAAIGRLRQSCATTRAAIVFPNRHDPRASLASSLQC